MLGEKCIKYGQEDMGFCLRPENLTLCRKCALGEPVDANSLTSAASRLMCAHICLRDMATANDWQTYNVIWLKF